MQATIVSYRRGRHTQTDNQMILVVEGVSKRAEAEKLKGKSVEWVADGKKKTSIKGSVQAPHGNKGAVRVLFERGMPGQALLSRVTLN